MEFETQVLETLHRLEEKITAVAEWKAGVEPRCSYHRDQINQMKSKLYGNGNKGIERRLDAVEDVACTIRKVWIALLIAGALAIASFISQLYQEADNAHGIHEDVQVNDSVQ